jgi:FkbM family methyltransferase
MLLMSRMNHLLSKFDANNILGKWIAAVLATTYTNLIAHARQLIYPQDGLWVHQSQDGCMVRRSIQSNVNISFYLDSFDSLLWKDKPQYGDTVVIAGSGLGEEALFVSKLVGTTGKVVGLEPDNLSYACHKLSVEKNRTTNTVVKKVALTAHGNDMHLSDFGDEKYVNNQVHTQETNNTYKVSSVTLEDIFNEYAKVDLLYLNIEGGEEDVLFNTADDLIKKLPMIYVGCHGFLEHCPDNLQQMVIERLNSLNFKTEVRQFDPTWIETYPSLYTCEEEIATNKEIIESWVFAQNMSIPLERKV